MKKNKKIFDVKIKKYFTYFSKKNLDELSKMFSNNVSLVDWNINVKGKKKVLDINKKIFKNKKILVKHEESFYNFAKNVVSCKIKVIINNKKLNVIDLIYFDKNMKIKKIMAYLR
ncbi:hypothetical protein N9404_04740 [Candidatus Pelagibacter sp.]|jgi:hypothetical protein|nr:hypothetical protein [Candidatus Pelagibacter sp.]